MTVPDPAVARREVVVDELFGTRLEDPYRWLEDGTSPETRAWVAAQNARTEAALAALPERERFRARLTELLRTGLVTAPTPRGNRYFFTRRLPGQQQPVLLLRRGAGGPETVLVDPNALDATGLTTIDWWYPSPDGRRLAYGLSRSGDEQSTLYLLDTDTGQPLPDRIPRTRGCSLAWLPDGSGFFFTRLPETGSVPPGEEHYHRHVWLHRLGADPARAERVWGAGRHPQEAPQVLLSADGRWLVVAAALGWSRTELHLLDRERPEAGFRSLVAGVEALYHVQLAGSRLAIHTNEGAPNYRLFFADLDRPERAAWREVIPAGEHTLQQTRVVGDTIGALYLVNATSEVRLFGLDGTPRESVPVPPLGTVDLLRGEAAGHELCFGYTSFTAPSRAYRHDLATGATTTFAESATTAPTAEIDVRQVWYPSRDGTRVSMFVVHRRGLTLDGNNPALLTGYGGFNISRTPGFSPSSYAWLELGGVWALPNLRGGGEYGESWHAAGRRDLKQNVFDDFHAAAEWLIANRYTRPERLAIRGRSNGGLLMGVALTQRPELYRAVAVEVPLLDMVRYQHFLLARLWVPEYGDAEASAEEFGWLHAYSPYHRLRAGTRYPATLFTTAAGDSRVHPLHALKMAALMQSLVAPDPARPVLLRVEGHAGHGIGKPIGKLVDEETDAWSFLYHGVTGDA